jgi:hypothetical protein
MNRYAVPILAAAMALVPLWGGAPAATPPNGGTISIEPKTGDGEYDPSTAAFVGAASDALAAKGFTILPDPGHAAYVAELVLSRVDVGTGSAKVRAGKAGGTRGGSYGSVGAGITVPFTTGETRLVPLQRIQVEMRIRKRGEPEVIWNGAAVTVRAAGTRKGADDMVAADLSTALLRSYPVRIEEVVGVP